ncbi:MAG: glycosyltransferase [Patulibacter sp.]
MLVSIVIPTYQRAGFVETAIESVLRQDHPDVELIVIDDGSTDGTTAVLERIAERADPERFRWWRHENVGQSETTNRAFAAARGELLGYISSDDYFLPGAITRLVEAAREHPDAEVVYPWCDVVDEADRATDTLEFIEHSFLDALRWNMCLVGAGALVRRGYLERVGGWDPTLPHCPDFDWWLRGGDTRFVCVPERLAVWRRHDESLTTSGGAIARTLDQIRMLDKIFDREDLAPEVAAVRGQAYGSLLIANGASLLTPEDDGPRFDVWDTVGPRVSRVAKHSDEAVPWLKHQVRRYEQQARATEVIAEQRHRTIVALQAALEDDEARIAALETALAAARAAAVPAAAPAPAARPIWLRAGRRLTPPKLRHRLGVAVHRLRRRA